MDQADIDRIARGLFDANMRRERFEPLRGRDRPDSLQTAYRIQDRLCEIQQAEAFAGPLGGHKIALTSPAIQELCGVDQPVYGPVFEKTIHHSPATIKASEFVRLGIEFEVAAEIGDDVPMDGAPFDRESIAVYVKAVMPAFELIEDRNADYSELDAESILTDRCWCGGVVLGRPVEDWRGLDLAVAPVRAAWNGEIIDQGVAGDALGHPLQGLAWVANHLAGQDRPLHRGDIVITGSALKTRFASAGDHVIYTVDGLGQTELHVAD